ncbi:hypothetical protein Tcan_00073 [Toxocara canis]|uniref:Uncharacterized protein n=1 Tax=Toxocara canis TaxID=6265 RepID=A0A0B2W562_TOXCA|nr:hypothetical protein Tcan_00073 [Toxocara canis]
MRPRRVARYPTWQFHSTKLTARIAKKKKILAVWWREPLLTRCLKFLLFIARFATLLSLFHLHHVCCGRNARVGANKWVAWKLYPIEVIMGRNGVSQHDRTQ